MSKTIKRRVEINIETHEITIIRRGGAGARRTEFCGRCQAEVCAFSLEQFAVFVQATVEEVELRVFKGELHLIWNNHQSPFVCGSSFENDRR